MTAVSVQKFDDHLAGITAGGILAPRELDIPLTGID